MTLSRVHVSVVRDLLVVRTWRIVQAEPTGCFMWFDPSRETPMVRSTPPDGDLEVRPTPSLGPEKEPSSKGGVIPDEGHGSDGIPEGVQQIGLFQRTEEIL